MLFYTFFRNQFLIFYALLDRIQSKFISSNSSSNQIAAFYHSKPLRHDSDLASSGFVNKEKARVTRTNFSV